VTKAVVGTQLGGVLGLGLLWGQGGGGETGEQTAGQETRGLLMLKCGLCVVVVVVVGARRGGGL